MKSMGTSASSSTAMHLGVKTRMQWVTIIDPVDVVPSVPGQVPFSTRPSELRVATAGGAGRGGALLQNRASQAALTADPAVNVGVSGTFGRMAPG